MTDLDDLKKELDQIWAELHTKQDRIKPAVAVAFLIWIVGATVSGAWWAATTTAQLGTLQQATIESARNQYSVTAASQDFRLRDQRLDFIQQQLDVNTTADKDERERLKARMNVHEKKLRDLELKK